MEHVSKTIGCGAIIIACGDYTAETMTPLERPRGRHAQSWGGPFIH